MFEIRKSEDGQWYFVLKASNGEIIAVSKLYTTEAACRNGIESVRKKCTDSRCK